ncbi:hypothetical protein SporoP8_12505 [Sporosarcina ureae]|uniref:hypothetical protein n=1 Tax=Sporosarcina ureae TaxID=1571 RepID=UPI000A14A1AA|nr:hypothetical protein [Sporosarcina ureae]ARJ39622.1 hypothetical protein SporoP8_12505 [Sporosarcina ureae]
MRIALICPSNMLFMPYVDNYVKILKENEVDFTIINWDRLHLGQEGNILSYKDKKVGHQRGYLSYYRYSRFIVRQLKHSEFDKVIVFGIQLTYFLKAYLQKRYKENYIMDIRDYNKSLKLFTIKKSIDSSFFTTISSPGYKEWLPTSSKYVINHNTTVKNIGKLERPILKSVGRPLNISYVGTITNLDVNLQLIHELQNNPDYFLKFHGDGMINEDIEQYVKEKEIHNVSIKGRYQKNEEVWLYKQADLVNMLLFSDHINNRTCLSNRLYNAVIHGKPLLSLNNTYLSDVIEQYKLGLVVDSLSEISQKLNQYVNNFNEAEYEKGREAFLHTVIEENANFKMRLEEFISGDTSKYKRGDE